MTTPSLGWQLAPDAKRKSEALTGAMFQVDVLGLGSAVFSELGGITSEVEATEYTEAGAKGPEFGRFIGKAKPPTVTLKRAMSSGPDSAWVWAWHIQARGASAAAYKHATLKLFSANKGMDKPVKIYELANAFPTKVEINGMKAGGSEVVLQTVVLQCDEITEMTP